MHVQPLMKKLGISALLVIVGNILLITLAMYWEIMSESTVLWLETAIFAALQFAVILFHFRKPLASRKQKLVYWIIAEALTLVTIGFWGFYIVGEPIWLSRV